MKVDARFAIVPLWLVESDVSDAAVRAYALLAARYADGNTGECEPSNAEVGQHMGCSERKAIRALKELLADGAITRQRRFVEGHETSSITTLRRVKSDPEGGCQICHPGMTGMADKPEVVNCNCNSVSTINTRSDKSVTPNQPSSFDSFYDAYPRREARGAAERAYRAAVKKSTPDEIMAGLGRWKAKWNADQTERKFIPLPATWLNAARWEDELATAEFSSAARERHRRVERDRRNLTDAERTAAMENKTYPYDEASEAVVKP